MDAHRTDFLVSMIDILERLHQTCIDRGEPLLASVLAIAKGEAEDAQRHSEQLAALNGMREKMSSQNTWRAEREPHEAVMESAELERAEFEGAALEGAALEGAALEGAELERAELERDEAALIAALDADAELDRAIAAAAASARRAVEARYDPADAHAREADEIAA